MKYLTILFIAALMCSCGAARQEAEPAGALKDAFADKFLIGVAVNQWQMNGEAPEEAAVAARHYSSIVAENVMKCEKIHPEEEGYYWAAADSFVDFGEKNGQFVVGHCLVWHEQLAPWFCIDKEGNPVDSLTLKQRLRDHITTIMTRYKGRVKGWDVLNEAILDDGSYRPTPFYRILGEGYIPYIFAVAHEADPDAELYYNDFGMDHPGKRDKVVSMVKAMREAGLRVDAIGMQAHMGMDYPELADFEKSLEAFASTGAKVMLTEFDMSALPTVNMTANISEMTRMREGLNPYPDGLPEDVAERWNERMDSVMQICLNHAEDISRVTFWGVHDGNSWKNNWPVFGRIDYALPFDRALNPKPFIKKYIK